MKETRGLIYLLSGERVHCNAWSSDSDMWSMSCDPVEWPDDLKVLHSLCDDCARPDGEGHDANCFYHGPY